MQIVRENESREWEYSKSTDGAVSCRQDIQSLPTSGPTTPGEIQVRRLVRFGLDFGRDLIHLSRC